MILFSERNSKLNLSQSFLKKHFGAQQETLRLVILKMKTRVKYLRGILSQRPTLN